MNRETKEEKQHRSKAMAMLSNEGRKHFEFIEYDQNEHLITEIRKHPFGLMIIFLTGALIVLSVVAIGILGLMLDFESSLQADNINDLRVFLVMISFVLSVGVLVAVYIASFLYKSNVIYLTNQKIAQVVYKSLFSRKISQLSVGDIQDVTVVQKGVLAHFFNYGTLTIETSGEQENYNFSYVPNPYQAAKLIVGAYEQNREKYGN